MTNIVVGDNRTVLSLVSSFVNCGKIYMLSGFIFGVSRNYFSQLSVNLSALFWEESVK